jgi:hypothetical protein
MRGAGADFADLLSTAVSSWPKAAGTVITARTAATTDAPIR